MLRTKTAALSCSLAACIMLTACTSSSNPSPAPTPTPALSNLSGDYSGTVQDAQNGTGTATATLAQTGSSAGGAITITVPGGTITAQIALSITSSNSVGGAMVIDYPNGTTCTFSTTGTYNTGTNVLSGSYTAVTNCSGDAGTYSLTQQCTDTVSSVDRRVMTTPKC